MVDIASIPTGSYGKVTDRVNLEGFTIKRDQFGEMPFFCLIIPGNGIEIKATNHKERGEYA